MTDMELNILIGVVGVLISIGLIVAIWRRFDVANSAAKVQEDMANFYTPAILEKTRKKDEEESNADGKQTSTEGSDSEGSTEASEDDGSQSEGDSK